MPQSLYQQEPDTDAPFQKVLQMLNRKKAAFLVCDRVLVETVWLLRSHYDWTAEELAGAFATFGKDIVKRHKPFAGSPS